LSVLFFSVSNAGLYELNTHAGFLRLPPSRFKETAAIHSQTVIRLSIRSSIKLNHQCETLLYLSTELFSLHVKQLTNEKPGTIFQ